MIYLVSWSTAYWFKNSACFSFEEFWQLCFYLTGVWLCVSDAFPNSGGSCCSFCPFCSSSVSLSALTGVTHLVSTYIEKSVCSEAVDVLISTHPQRMMHIQYQIQVNLCGLLESYSTLWFSADHTYLHSSKTQTHSCIYSLAILWTVP